MRRRPRRDVIWERFGDPIGSYAGDAPVGVRSVQIEVDYPCGCAEEDTCAGCGMPIGSCSCPGSNACPRCGMAPMMGRCECGIGMFEASAQDLKEGAEGVCSECGMMEVEGRCECSGMNEAEGVCSECGMMEVEGRCECSKMYEGKLSQVTPKGYEHVVKALKKQPKIRNPWAVAWHMKSKG